MERELGHINQLQREFHRREDEPSISSSHNITVELIDGVFRARQINNPVSITSEQEKCLKEFFANSSTHRVNIPPEVIPFFQKAKISEDQIIKNPLNVILISSKGLLNESDWTSYQPSEGIWVLAEWLVRREPSASPLCIDPNMISEAQLETILRKYGKGALIGFSSLPVNLRNDAKLITRIKSILPDCLIEVGGIGSESLNLLPTKSGSTGIAYALPVDLVVPGTAVTEMSRIAKAIYNGQISNGNELKDYYLRLVKELHEQPFDFMELMRNIQKSREVARHLFIPEVRGDIVHPIGYKKANNRAVKGNIVEITSVLIDNRCDQGCYFCASPKAQIFFSLDEGLEHIREKSKNAKVIAFNDNDLSNAPEQTIELCQGLVRLGISQEKHGKMRADKYHPELINALAGAGFVRLAVGVESFAQRVRNSLGKKNFTQEAINSTLSHMLEAGIRPEINLILFTPHETIESLEETVRKSLEWVDKGASIYMTMGLFATPNSPGVLSLLKSGKISDKINYAEIYYPGMKEPLLFPEQWKTDPNLETIKTELLTRRKGVIRQLADVTGVDIPVPIEAFVALALLANRFSVEGYKTEEETMNKIDEYVRKEITQQYISI